jgi:hypothetical protein
MVLKMRLETDGTNDSWLVIDGLNPIELRRVIDAKSNERGKVLTDIMTEKGLNVPLKIDKNTREVANLIMPTPLPYFELIPVTREQVLATLEKRGNGLRVVDTYQTNRLPHLVRANAPTDRFVSLANFIDGIRRADNCVNVSLVMAEIDNLDVYHAVTDFGPDVLPSLAIEHAKTAAIALQRFAGGDPIIPFMVIYSGKKSFHCYWQFDAPILQADLAIICKAKDFMIGEIKRREPDDLADADRALLAIDPQPFFRATALGRIPCRHAEPGRFPQIGWRTGHQGIINVARLQGAIAPMVDRIQATERLAAIQRQAWNDSKPQREMRAVTDDDLRLAFPDARQRNGDGYSIRCPFHEDKTHSAFVSANGYIYCSVCCDSTKRYIGRVKSGGGIDKM